MTALEPNLEIFRHHFADRPVVPGILLLTEPHRTKTVETGHPDFLNLRNIRFKEFVRPGDTFGFGESIGTRRRVAVGDRVCCEYDLADEVNQSATGITLDSQSFNEQQIHALRKPEYWFLPEQIRVSSDLAQAEVELDTAAVATVWSYLKAVPSWETLLLVEAMGNLSLALNSLSFPEIDYDRFVFAQMKSLRIPHPRASLKHGPRFRISTRLSRRGSMIVWHASADAIEADRATSVCRVEGGVSYLRGAV